MHKIIVHYAIIREAESITGMLELEPVDDEFDPTGIRDFARHLLAVSFGVEETDKTTFLFRR